MKKAKAIGKFAEELGFNRSWGVKLLKKCPEVIEKGYVKPIPKGLRTYYIVEDEEGLKDFLRRKGYRFPIEREEKLPESNFSEGDKNK
jgi:hypothetical protein